MSQSMSHPELHRENPTSRVDGSRQSYWRGQIRPAKFNDPGLPMQACRYNSTSRRAASLVIDAREATGVGRRGSTLTYQGKRAHMAGPGEAWKDDVATRKEGFAVPSLYDD